MTRTMPDTMSAPTASAVSGGTPATHTSSAHVSTVSVRSVSAKTCANAEKRLSSLLASRSRPPPPSLPAAGSSRGERSPSCGTTTTRLSARDSLGSDACGASESTIVDSTSAELWPERRPGRRLKSLTNGAHMKMSTKRLTIVKPSMIRGSTSSSSSCVVMRRAASLVTAIVTAKSAITEKAEAPSSAAAAPRTPQRTRWCSAIRLTR